MTGRSPEPNWPDLKTKTDSRGNLKIVARHAWYCEGWREPGEADPSGVKKIERTTGKRMVTNEKRQAFQPAANHS